MSTAKGVYIYIYIYIYIYKNDRNEKVQFSSFTSVAVRSLLATGSRRL